MKISDLLITRPRLCKFFAMMLLSASITAVSGQKILRVGVAGLTHDHVHNIMHQFKSGEVIIAGIAESDPQLIARYKKKL